MRGHLEVMLAMALAGSSVVVGKILSVRVPVVLSAELSLCAALVVLLPLQAARRRELGLLGRRDLGWMFLQALFGMVLFRVLPLHGLRFTTAVQAGLSTRASPAVMGILSAAIMRERIGPLGILGIALTVAGLALTNLSGIRAAQDRFMLGSLLVLGAVVCESLLTVFRKLSGGRIGSITNTTMLVSMSAAMLLPFAIADLGRFPISSIQVSEWLAMIYYGAVATVIAYILWGHGALLIPAARTGMATAMMPVSALVLSAIVLKESLTPLSIGGCAAVVAGIIAGSVRAPHLCAAAPAAPEAADRPALKEDPT